MTQKAIPPAPDDTLQKASWPLKAVFALLLAITLALTTTGTAQAATYTISRYTCVDAKPITSSLTFGSGVNFTLASHPNTTVVLATTYSWGWKRDARGNVTPVPGVVYNQYHVRFLDASGRVLWTEWNSVPNGGSRTYAVGSNVRTIQVIANAYPYLGGGWAAPPAVGITFN